MGEISDKIKEYSEGDLSFDKLADWLAQFPYRPRRPFYSDYQIAELSADGEAWTDVEGTWDEVVFAKEQALLTDDEYDAILTRRKDYDDATHQRAGYTESSQLTVSGWFSQNMRTRWLALGVGGVAIWLVVTFGIVYGVTEWTGDDGAQAIVTGRSREQVESTTSYCVSYTVQGVVDQTCDKAGPLIGDGPPACYTDSEIGKPLPDSCR